MILRLLTGLTPKQEGNFVRAPRCFSGDVHTQLKNSDSHSCGVCDIAAVLAERQHCFSDQQDYLVCHRTLGCRLTIEMVIALFENRHPIRGTDQLVIIAAAHLEVLAVS